MAGLNYSTETLQISSSFLAYRNNITIYTEDEEKDKEFYRILFRRLLEGTNIVINDVFPLGSCDNVYKKCLQEDCSNGPCLYIMDGDIFIMTNPKHHIPHLYILDSYCIENKIIDEDAICQAFYNYIGKIDYDTVKTTIDYNAILNLLKRPFMCLYNYYALQQELCGYYTKDKSVRFFDVKTNKLRYNEIKKKINEVVYEISTKKGLNHSDIKKMYIERSLSYPHTVDSLLKYVSGKDYLLPCLFAFCSNKLNFKYGLDKEAKKFQLARYCSLDGLAGLRQAIIGAVSYSHAY